MAWYAECKRRNWYCIHGTDMICWYRQYCYDVWYASLSEEQKQWLEEWRKRKHEKVDQELRTCMMKLMMLTDILAGICNR